MTIGGVTYLGEKALIFTNFLLFTNFLFYSVLQLFFLLDIKFLGATKSVLSSLWLLKLEPGTDNRHLRVTFGVQPRCLLVGKIKYVSWTGVSMRWGFDAPIYLFYSFYSCVMWLRPRVELWWRHLTFPFGIMKTFLGSNPFVVNLISGEG